MESLVLVLVGHSGQLSTATFAGGVPYIHALMCRSNISFSFYNQNYVVTYFMFYKMEVHENRIEANYAFVPICCFCMQPVLSSKIIRVIYRLFVLSAATTTKTQTTDRNIAKLHNLMFSMLFIRDSSTMSPLRILTI